MEAILKSYLEHICGKDGVRENEPMSQRTSFKIGGEARFFVVVPTKEALARLISTLRYIDYPFYMVGNGTNLLVSDRGFDGVVIKAGFSEILENSCFIYADAGVSLKKVAGRARSIGLTGLEWSVGIPATVGGAVFMNAGAHGGQMSDVVAMVDVLRDGEIVTLDSRQLKFSYRKSVFHKRRDWIILGAYFYLERGERTLIEEREKNFLGARKSTQPTEPSAGSVFTRPKPDFAVGKVVDELGLKGVCVGSAKVSEKHAGFIVNVGGATARDVLSLMKLVRGKVYEKCGVRLKSEIQVLG
jgi:UDP-N-acetylmuramate dehydrogenase